MSFNLSLIAFGLLLVTITIGIQSAPVETIESIDSVKPDDSVEDFPKENENTLQKQTSARIVRRSTNTDNSKVFTDIKMNPTELIKISRKRRNIISNDGLNQRRKRALSSYDIYNTDPLYESTIEQQPFFRPSRSFAPIYWYPFNYERHIRSSPDLNQIYSSIIENDDDEDEDESDRYLYDNLRFQREYNIDDLPIDDDEEFFSPRYGLF